MARTEAMNEYIELCIADEYTGPCHQLVVALLLACSESLCRLPYKL
jgi:hypothetical protein